MSSETLTHARIHTHLHKYCASVVQNFFWRVPSVHRFVNWSINERRLYFRQCHLLHCCNEHIKSWHGELSWQHFKCMLYYLMVSLKQRWGGKELLWLTQIWINQNLITSLHVALSCITQLSSLPDDCKSTVGHFEILWLLSLWPMAKIADKGTICCNSLHNFMLLSLEICNLACGRKIMCGQKIKLS